jgi:hypothetical protein
MRERNGLIRKIVKIFMVMGMVVLSHAQMKDVPSTYDDIGKDRNKDLKKCFLGAVLEGKICHRALRVTVPRRATSHTIVLRNQNVFYPLDSDPTHLPLQSLLIDKGGNLAFLGFRLLPPNEQVLRKRIEIGRKEHADVNGDGEVNDEDLRAVLRNFGKKFQACSEELKREDLTTDINGDGIVDDADLLKVLFDFGKKSHPCILDITVMRR